MKMDLLITRSKNPHFYSIDQGSLSKIKVVDFGEYDLPQPKWQLARRLPWDVCSIIMRYLFLIYLKSFNFDLAGALVSINKSFTFEIYNEIFGVRYTHPLKAVKRVCNTLDLLARIYDDYLSIPRKTNYSLIKVVKPSNVADFLPWQTILDVFPQPTVGIIAGEGEKVYQFETGGFYGDTVWLTGRYNRDGIFKCKRFYHPIITIQLSDYDEAVPTSKQLNSNEMFKKFAALLRLAYGPTTGIYFYFDDDQHGENLFDISRTGFIEF